MQIIKDSNGWLVIPDTTETVPGRFRELMLQFAALTEECKNEKPAKLDINLSKIGHINSEVIAQLVKMHNVLPCNVSLVSVNTDLKLPFETVQLGKVLPISYS